EPVGDGGAETLAEEGGCARGGKGLRRWPGRPGPRQAEGPEGVDGSKDGRLAREVGEDSGGGAEATTVAARATGEPARTTTGSATPRPKMAGAGEEKKKKKKLAAPRQRGASPYPAGGLANEPTERPIPPPPCQGPTPFPEALTATISSSNSAAA